MSPQQLRVAVLGAGGLGRGMARMLAARPGFQLVAMADRQGYCFADDGSLNAESACNIASDDAIIELLNAHGAAIDGIFLALPNLPVNFFADTLVRIARETRFEGVLVDALKRTKAVEKLLNVAPLLAERNMLYITGAGATPGFLTTVASVAAMSFVEVLGVDIHFGVGVANWEQYRATIREDLLHMDGFDAEKVAAMSDAEIEAELDRRNGILELVKMEHADDIILELAGVCPRDRVTVGGMVDTRNAKKPVSTTVRVSGRTLSGEIGTHTFTVADEATMVDNVCGPALGFLTRGTELWRNGRNGLMTSAELMPAFRVPAALAAPQPAAEVV